MGRWLALLAALATVSVGCDEGSERAIRVDHAVEVAGVPVVDVYAPTSDPDDDGHPIVVMLHGGDGDPARLETLARAVAADGAVVHVPTWPVITERRSGEELDAAYLAQVESVVCALRHARRTAEDYGGDPDDITLHGHSAGAFVGAAVAMVAEPPWPGIDCDADVDHRPHRFVGTSGDYTGWTIWAHDDPEVAAAYDPTLLPVTNDGLEVRLLHGLADDTIWLESPFALRDHLDSEDVDVALLALDVGHGDPVDGDVDLVAAELGRLVHDEPTAFDPEESATFGFVDDRCVYTGEQLLTRGAAVDVEVRNDADTTVYFWLVAFEEWRPADDGLELDGRPWVNVEDPPEMPAALAFFPVAAGEQTRFALALVDGSWPWTLWCMPSDDHPAAQMMHPAAELVVTDDVEPAR